MKSVKIILEEFVEGTIEEKVVEYENNMSIQELLESIEIKYFQIDFSAYYDFGYECCNSTLFCGFMQLPYVISDGKVMWLPNHSEVLVSDFLETHEVDSIRIFIGIPAAGSPFFFKLIEIWDYYSPIFSDISVVLSIGCFSIQFVKWLTGKFGNKLPPLPLVEFINKKEIWNSKELAMLLKITDDEAKYLLKGFGYDWDNKFQAFKKSHRTKEIVKEIKNIPWEGDG